MEFVENEFAPVNANLVALVKKIKDKKLNFNPYLVTSAINAEVEAQLKNVIEVAFKGMAIDQLAVCFEEVEKYIKTEEDRYKTFKDAQTKETMSPKENIDNDVKIATDEFVSSESVTHTPSNPGVLVLDKTKKKKK